MPIIQQTNVVNGAYAGVYRTAGAPVSGGSGSFANIAPIGAQLVRTDTGVQYTNTGTQSSPTWTVVGTQT